MCRRVEVRGGTQCQIVSNQKVFGKSRVVESCSAIYCLEVLESMDTLRLRGPSCCRLDRPRVDGNLLRFVRKTTVGSRGFLRSGRGLPTDVRDPRTGKHRYRCRCLTTEWFLLMIYRISLRSISRLQDYMLLRKLLSNANLSPSRVLSPSSHPFLCLNQCPHHYRHCQHHQHVHCRVVHYWVHRFMILLPFVNYALFSLLP